MEKYTQRLGRVIAHRGASADAPENTLAALNLAFEQGAKAVEVDAMISHDGVAFLHHDDGLARCTNAEGYLCAHSAAQLDALDASGKHTQFKPEPLPRLDAAVKVLIANDMGLNLEIKPTPGLERETAQAVVNSLKNIWPQELPLVLSSFSKEALSAALELWPQAPRALITCAVPTDWHEQLRALQCTNLHMAAPLLDKDMARNIKSADYGLFCYTVNQVEQAKQLLAMGVDGVFTDVPKHLLNAGI